MKRFYGVRRELSSLNIHDTHRTGDVRNATSNSRRFNYSRTRRRPLVGDWGRAHRDDVRKRWMPSSRGLVWCCLVGNLAAFNRGTHALRRVATATDRSNRLLVHSATATIRTNRPFCDEEAFEHLAAHVSRDLVPCRDLFEKKDRQCSLRKGDLCQGDPAMSSAAP